MHVGYVLYVNILFSLHYFILWTNMSSIWETLLLTGKSNFRLELQGRLFPQTEKKKLNFGIHPPIQIHCHKLTVLFLLVLFVWLVGVFPPLVLKLKPLIL